MDEEKYPLDSTVCALVLQEKDLAMFVRVTEVPTCASKLSWVEELRAVSYEQ